jgi:hypothetical protein
VLSIPVPKIIAWSSNKDNPVGAEYILEEKAPGQTLGNLWHQMPKKSRLDIISQVVEMENRLASLTFEQHGCLYFRDAHQKEVGTGQPLITYPPLPPDIAGRFTLGALTTPELWESEDRSLDLERGPCETVSSFVF